MSVRGAEGTSPSAGSESSDRRGGAGQRVHFEALVAMAEAQGGSGFEAESVDMSPDGMRLRTAYVPQIGEKLCCRFDHGGSEITAAGEVIWRNEQARGGEFGLRFTGVDREAAEALKAMYVSAGGGSAPADAPSAGAAKDASKGTRVRLHIEGLGSPMKARVRESVTGEVLVGSNLEFLRVGRSLELEDVDHGVRREAHIDHVKVEIDPATSIPQLVVSLRYDDDREARNGGAKAFGAKAPMPGLAGGKAPPRAPLRETLDRGADEAEEHDRGAHLDERARPSRSPKRPSMANAGASASAVNNEPHDGGEDIEAGADGVSRADKLRGLGTKAASAGKLMADKVGPPLAAVSAKAKDAMAGMVAALRRKRVERAEAQQASLPRRMTAPPANGALRSEGRRLVRDDGTEDDETPPPPPANKRAAIIGSALGLLAVLAVFGVTRFMGAGRLPAPETATADTQTASALATAGGTASTTFPAPSGALTANVPLFGATPLSTTEPVPSMPPPEGSALAGAGAAPGLAGAAAPGADPSAALADPALGDPADAMGEDGDDGDEGPAKKEWGQGRVRNPNVLRIKMDGPIERLNGASGAMGFTISLPGRRSLAASSELARKDKRIASLNVVNNAHGAEVTIQFKDGVPAYMAKAKGDRLEIALGTEGKKKVATKSSADKKKKAAADKKKAAAKTAKPKAAKKKPAQ